uniref:Uncharacterized protein n=1 Tax=Arundo donax TaxID=35708 RepID=A0A0A8Y5W9_ARUDO
MCYFTRCKALQLSFLKKEVSY